MQTKTATIRLPKPHSQGQQEILDWPGHGVAFCGRRYGKTQVAVLKLITSAAREPGLYWWVGLSWRSASMKRAWRLLKRYVRQLWQAIGERPDRYIREAEKELKLPGGGEIWLRTAERPDSLAGEGIKGVVLDEFSLMDEAVWIEYVAPTLIDFGGWALFVGVPKGRNWGFHLWNNAHTRANWKAWQFSSYDNPRLNKERIDDLARGLPQRLIDQEIYALVVDDSGAVFRLAGVAKAQAQPGPQAGHEYTIGVDWGRSGDYTVICIFDATERCIAYLDRFTGLSFEVQLGRVQAAIERWNPVQCTLEMNSIGGPLFETLQGRLRDGAVTGFTTTNANKAALVDGLALALERQSITLLDDPVLIAELHAYEMETLPSGMIRYAAPAGAHDDCVMALLLAYGPYMGEGAPVDIAMSYLEYATLDGM